MPPQTKRKRRKRERKARKRTSQQHFISDIFKGVGYVKGLGIKGLDRMMAFASCCGYWKFLTFVQELKLEVFPYHHNDLVLQILVLTNVTDPK